MNVARHEQAERLAARAALVKTWRRRAEALYADAAEYRHGGDTRHAEDLELAAADYADAADALEWGRPIESGRAA